MCLACVPSRPPIAGVGPASDTKKLHRLRQDTRARTWLRCLRLRWFLERNYLENLEIEGHVAISRWKSYSSTVAFYFVVFSGSVQTFQRFDRTSDLSLAIEAALPAFFPSPAFWAPYPVKAPQHQPASLTPWPVRLKIHHRLHAKVAERGEFTCPTGSGEPIGYQNPTR